MGLTEWLAGYITKLIDWGGYLSVTILMTMESMVFPVPSEAVMPFAGFLVAEGKMTLLGAVVFSTIGSIIGSSISYVAGYYGGKPFVKKFGKYVFLNQHHLDTSEKFFNKYGEITILVCRFIPIVRHLISIPAGFARMNVVKFLIFTIVGAGIWNGFLTYIGMILKNNWEEVMKYSKVLDIVVIAAIAGLILYILYRKVWLKRKTKTVKKKK
jgi:membrane protein DedA with SNARE-associated domain